MKKILNPKKHFLFIICCLVPMLRSCMLGFFAGIVLLFCYLVTASPLLAANCGDQSSPGAICCPNDSCYGTRYETQNCTGRSPLCCESCTQSGGGSQGGIVNPVIPGLRGDYGAKLGSMISGIMGFLLTLAGLLSFFYLLTGGIQWITSGGDKAGIDTARQKILNAIIGLIITFATWAIMKVVFQFLGIDFPNFSLPKLV